MDAPISMIETYLDAGGPLMRPLSLLGVILWFLLIRRHHKLRAGVGLDVEQWLTIDESVLRRRSRHRIVAQAIYRARRALRYQDHLLSARLSIIFSDIRRSLSTYHAAIRSITVAAPLMGLLGTVQGMIESFRSLGDMSLFSQSGGVAGGISMAMLTTQLGLSVAIPGLLVGRLLDRREARIQSRLVQLHRLLMERHATNAQEVEL